MACMQDTKCFTLPTSIAASSVTNIQIQINYQSPTSGSQTWTWKIYDWVHSAYITVGTNAGAPEWGAWKLLTFSVSGTLSHYIRSSDAVKNTNLKIMHRLTAEDDRRYLGQTMGLDEPQLRFATRLQTGEALAYSDEFAEAVHITVPRSLRPSRPGPVRPSPKPPFADCDRCRSQCAYRGAGLAMVRDPRIVNHIKNDVAALETKGLAASDIEARWTALLARLRNHVTSFPSLPSAEPDLADAAYCLFLHALAVRTMRYQPAWPRAVATRLGIPPHSDAQEPPV